MRGRYYTLILLLGAYIKFLHAIDIINTIAGTGGTAYNGDSIAATSSVVYAPYGVALDSLGNVYIGDTISNRIRKITISTGIISTIAGTGSSTFSGDGGFATSAGLCNPVELFVDTSENVYFPENCSHRIRKVTGSTNIITTVAGSGGTGSFSGDGGLATSATLYNPYGVTVDTAGRQLYRSTQFHSLICPCRCHRQCLCS